MDYEITEYLIQHKDGIKEELGKLLIKSKINPILRSHLREAILNETAQMVSLGLNINYEDAATVISYEHLMRLFGEEFFNL